MPNPTLHLTSAAYVRAHRVVWPHAYTIQAVPNPLRGELMDGRVTLLTPTLEEWDIGSRIVAARREGRPVDSDAVAAYRGSMEARWEGATQAGHIGPGGLTWHLHRGAPGACAAVPASAVLTCSCSRAHARAGECHRAWAAPYLVRGGWDVYLDGLRVTA